jgi:general secretion pathway protein D
MTITRICLFLLALTLCGCANDGAFLHAKSSLLQGDNTALRDLEKIVQDNPANVEYKNFYYKQRDSIVNRLLQKAETEKINGHWFEANSAYEEVLEIDQKNSRARQGVASVELAKSNEAKLQEASDLLVNNQNESAEVKVKQVLIDEPNNTRAKILAAAIERRKTDRDVVYSKVISKFKKPISLELKDANIKTVFELLSKATGVNFILDKELKADTKVSVYVKHTTVDNALKNIFSSNQLSRKVLNENTVLVYPNSKKSEYEEIIAKTFYLKSVEPKKAEELIRTVVKTKDIFIDDKLNILVMRDTYEAIRNAEKLINAYDLGDPEVLLEVEILEISSTLASELGLRWPSQVTAGVKGSAGSGQLSFDELKHFNSGLATLTITDPVLIFNLRKSDGGSNLLANPHIRVKNHKKAKVHIGDRVPVITNTSTATGFVSESVAYLDVGLKLDVEPSIMMDDEVSIDIGLEVSNIVNEVVTKSGSVSYRLGTRNAETTLRLKNGETQVLAGLINNEERTSADKVPGLSSLPIIGRLFSNKSQSNNKTELVLLITPKIVRNLDISESNPSEFSIGTETGNARPSMGSSAVYQIDIQPTAQVQQESSEIPAGESPALTPIMPIQLNIPLPPPLPEVKN